MPVELKGSSFTLSVIYIHDAKLEEIRQAIQKKVEQAPFFLRNAPVVINVSKLTHKSNWIKLYQIVLDIGLRVIGVSGCHNSTLKQAIIYSGLPLLTESKVQKYRMQFSEPFSTTTTRTIAKTQLVNTPVRSGQQIYAHNSDLIVTNSVSPGAEIIADGNIHIYGMMRGRVLAGASGDGECQIFCTHLFPELMSIGGQYWLSDQIPEEFLGKSAKLSLQGDVLTIQPLI